ncbi:MAG: pyridoxamine 5'-phosphate oxidase family protein [Austwickia sp.]|nr:pyridoxamine 5'-phosphate oxidase family protein [Actinomycetota bacterium]MCB1254330.1 pyridoxamine 5'-phosphate oxidase family protein [Austwickia sp.]MCO5309412.1 pyridoxamine 5'-phosphate oxidase family protein [Austwickia sp.]
MADPTPVRTDDEAVAHVVDLIKGQRTAMITTRNEAGLLVSRPLACQESDFDGTVWFFCRDSGPLAGQVRADAACNVAYTEEGRWVSLAGRAEIVRDVAKNEELWSPFAKAYFGVEHDDPDVALLKVTAETAHYWDSPGKVVQVAGLLKALATGSAAPEGDHAVVDMS